MFSISVFPLVFPLVFSLSVSVVRGGESGNSQIDGNSLMGGIARHTLGGCAQPGGGGIRTPLVLVLFAGVRPLGPPVVLARTVSKSRVLKKWQTRRFPPM